MGVVVMKRLCIKEFKMDNLIFAKGMEYEVEYNPVDGNLWIYNVWGCSPISKVTLDKHFI